MNWVDLVAVVITGMLASASVGVMLLARKRFSDAKKALKMEYGTSQKKIDKDTMKELPSVSDEKHLQGEDYSETIP